LPNNSAHVFPLQEQKVQDVSSLEAGDGAHLFHLIQSTLRATDASSPWLPASDVDRLSLDSLKQVLKHLESVEQDVD
jgi:hypothetical protein